MTLTTADRALLVEDVLVLADLHLGKGASANIDVPVGHGSDVLDRFESLLERFEPAEVVVAGDLLHSFDTIPRTVRDTVAALGDLGEDHGAPVTVTPGNHDTMLSSVWDGPTVDEYAVGDAGTDGGAADAVILHGHEPPTTDADRYVVGHDHPTIEIEGQRRPCYLVGEGVYDGADVVMVPAFNRLLRGVRVNEMRADEFRSPLVTDADALRPVVRDVDAGETLTFPPLGEFRTML